ncbi:hypothetical protein GF322_00845 [Candidatus Dependentiae bacterium]|nr:hypothetical protein [Candidatus Dependentiae bacterium]
MIIKKLSSFIFFIFLYFTSSFTRVTLSDDNCSLTIPSSVSFVDIEKLNVIDQQSLDLLLKYKHELNLAKSKLNSFQIIEHLSELKFSNYPEEFWDLFQAACIFNFKLISHALAREYIKKIKDPRKDEYFVKNKKISNEIKDFIRKQFFLMYNDHDILNNRKKVLSLDLKEVAYSKKLEILNCKLNLSNLHLSSIDGILYILKTVTLDQIPQIEQVDLQNNCLENIPEELCKASQIKILNVSNNKIKKLPTNIWNLKNLIRLDAKNNQIKYLPETISYLEKLCFLDISHNKLKQLPNKMGELRSLKFLILDNNQLNYLPESFKRLDLQKISLNDNNLCDDFLYFTPKIKKRPTDLKNELFFCTASDSDFFGCLIQLIGSIHKTNFDKTKKIAVFDLGLTGKQRDYLNTIDKVEVFDVEKTHPDILKKFDINKFGKKARGWYAWKPVVFKQALDMFDYFLYVDAGTIILKPLDNLFYYIQKKGYFLLEDQPWHIKYLDSQENVILNKNEEFKIKDLCTQHVLNIFNLNSKKNNWIAQSKGIISGVQGLSKALYQNYVLPIYELTKDLKNFQDDGSARYGFGWARHDQSIFSIFSRFLKLDLVPTKTNVYLDCVSSIEKFYFSDENQENKTDIFYACKGALKFSEFIRYKK